MPFFCSVCWRERPLHQRLLLRWPPRLSQAPFCCTNTLRAYVGSAWGTERSGEGAQGLCSDTKQVPLPPPLSAGQPLRKPSSEAASLPQVKVSSPRMLEGRVVSGLRAFLAKEAVQGAPGPAPPCGPALLLCLVPPGRAPPSLFAPPPAVVPPPGSLCAAGVPPLPTPTAPPAQARTRPLICSAV